MPAIYPDPSDVRSGVQYGPNGNDFTGTAAEIPPPVEPSQTTAHTVCRDGRGDPAEGVELTFRLIAPAPSVDSYGTSDLTAESGADGQLSIVLLKESQYKARRGVAGKWVFFETDDADTFELPQTLSRTQP